MVVVWEVISSTVDVLALGMGVMLLEIGMM
jgi:hypothetical protein